MTPASAGNYSPGVPQEQIEAHHEALAERLARVERAHAELLERVRRYEQERSEIKSRLRRILARLGAGAPR